MNTTGNQKTVINVVNWPSDTSLHFNVAISDTDKKEMNVIMSCLTFITKFSRVNAITHCILHERAYFILISCAS